MYDILHDNIYFFIQFMIKVKIRYTYFLFFGHQITHEEA